MPSNQLKSFSEKYSVPLAKVEEFWNIAKEQYGENWEAVAGTVKKMCIKYQKSTKEEKRLKFVKLLKENLTIDELEDNKYYLVKVTHIVQNRYLGNIKKTGKEIKKMSKENFFELSNIKATTSPKEDENKFAKNIKNKIKFNSRFDAK